MIGPCDTRGEKSYAYRVWLGNLRERERERDHLEDLGVDAWSILKYIFKNGIGAWTGMIDSIETGDGLL